MLVAIFKQYWVLFVANNFRGSVFASAGLLLIRAQLSGQGKKAGTRICWTFVAFFRNFSLRCLPISIQCITMKHCPGWKMKRMSVRIFWQVKSVGGAYSGDVQSRWRGHVHQAQARYLPNRLMHPTHTLCKLTKSFGTGGCFGVFRNSLIRMQIIWNP